MVVGGGGVRQTLDTLGLPHDDWLVAVALIDTAQEIAVKRDTSAIQAQGASVGVKVAEILHRMFG